MRVITKLLICVLAISLLSGVGGAFAVWKYFSMPKSASSQIPIYLSAFEYKPQEVLPDRESIGESHINLIESILNNSKVGLNKDKKNALYNECVERGENGREYVLYNWETIQGNNIKHAFETSDMEALEFALQYLPETDEFLVYTCKDDDLDDAEILGTTKINTYRTRLQKNSSGKWIASGSAEGYATVVTAPGSSRRVIDHNSWTAWE